MAESCKFGVQPARAANAPVNSTTCLAAEIALLVEQLLKGKTFPVRLLLQKELEGRVLLLVSMCQMAPERGFQEAEYTTR